MSTQAQFQVPVDYNEVLTQAGGEQLRATLTRYLFSPGEELDVSDRRVSLNRIPRARITPIKSFTFMGRRETEDIILAEDDSPTFVVEEKIQRAKDSADEIIRAYGDRGAVEFEQLAGAREDFIRDLEVLIFGRSEDGSPDVPVNLIDLRESLAGKLNGSAPFAANLSPQLRSLVTDIAAYMLHAADKAIDYQTKQVDLAETEIERRALAGGVGRPGFTSMDKAYFAQLKRTPKTKVMEEMAQAQRDAIGAIITSGAKEAAPKVEDDRIPCPLCAEPIKPQARKCKHCGEWLTAKPAGRKPQSLEKRSLEKKAANQG
jgi:hypothetical protein